MESEKQNQTPSSAGGNAEQNKQIRKRILRLIHEVNAHEMIGKVYPTLEFVDDGGWRIVFGKSLAYPEYQKYSAARKLLQMAIFDRDFDGEYYWIPYDRAPDGYTSPALRLMRVRE
jgi:hypothetical protein